MALGKRKKSRNGFGRRKSKYAKRRKVSEAQIMAVVNRRTGGFVGLENKFLDTELTPTNLTTSFVALNPTGTGCTDSLSVPAEGTGQSERNGRNYTIHKIYLHGNFAIGSVESSTSPLADIRCRVVIYIDTQTNNAEANPSNIMDQGGTDNLLAFRNLEEVSRFRVLFDKTLVMRFNNQMNEGAINLFASGLRVAPFNFYHTFKEPIKVQCNATTANVTSCTNSQIGLLAIASTTTNTPTITYQCRVRFRG